MTGSTLARQRSILVDIEWPPVSNASHEVGSAHSPEPIFVQVDRGLFAVSKDTVRHLDEFARDLAKARQLAASTIRGLDDPLRTIISNGTIGTGDQRTIPMTPSMSNVPSGHNALLDVVRGVSGVMSAQWGTDSQYIEASAAPESDRMELLVRIDEAMQTSFGRVAEHVSVVLV